MFNGLTLIEWGFTPGPWFTRAIEVANGMARGGRSVNQIIAVLRDMAPPKPTPLDEYDGSKPLFMNILPESDEDAQNIANVEEHMREIMRIPTVRAGAVMPDACPSGSKLGTIPVGGVVASSGIHPGMHSADICCSMAVTVFDRDVDGSRLLDAGMKLSHFGTGGRPRGAHVSVPTEIMTAFEANDLLSNLTSCMREHFATQGDGNHFFYVGRLASDGRVALVTHHGSRKPGALLYKAGMSLAEETRRRVCPDVAVHNAWIEADTKGGEAYWSALQTIRAWTKASHFAIHDMVSDYLGLTRHDRFWNEHNFVFRKSDGLFYHAKGATPAYPGFSADNSGLTLIPLNMAEPILITRGRNAANSLGFAPHGAGRNLSRTAYMQANTGKTTEQMFDEQTKGIDARAFSGKQDPSELPEAYKSASTVRSQISHFGLATVEDTIDPIGCIMAGWQDQTWRAVRDAKRAAKLRREEKLESLK